MLLAFPWWIVILAVAVTTGLLSVVVWRRRRKHGIVSGRASPSEGKEEKGRPGGEREGDGQGRWDLKDCDHRDTSDEQSHAYC